MGVSKMNERGALNRYSVEVDAHAERYYKEVLAKKCDYLQIAKNTGFSIEQVQIVKHYIFRSRHYLGGSTMTSKFYPSYEIAESWRRLSSKSPKNIQRHDIVLLQHELYEISLLIQHPTMSQATAHAMASKIYPYDVMSNNYYNRRG